ncbi:hypothetical protein HDU91_006632, partial [Kappamyces sp. JEL0680]
MRQQQWSLDCVKQLSRFESCSSADMQDVLGVCLELLAEPRKQSLGDNSLSKSNPWYMTMLVYSAMATRYERLDCLVQAFDALKLANANFALNASVRFRMAAWAHIVADSSDALQTTMKILKRAILLEPFFQDQLKAAVADRFEVANELNYVRMCKEKLAFLYCQSRDDSEATELLASLDYSHRLSQHVLNYAARDLPVFRKRNEYARIYDRVWDEDVLQRMRNFLKPKSLFWKEHGYNEYQSNGYFSYVFPLAGTEPSNLLEQVILSMFALLKRDFPVECSKIKVAEWWAHARPHSSGHQLHYDSENEGQGT